jgi:hypothetical protein
VLFSQYNGAHRIRSECGGIGGDHCRPDTPIVTPARFVGEFGTGRKARQRRSRPSFDPNNQQLSDEEKEYKSKRKLVQERLIKFATRIPAFMYLTDFRENTLQDVITKLEPDLFLAVTGLTVTDFHLLVRLKVFNTEQMNQAVFAFRRYEDASLRYTGIESHEGLTHYGLYDTVVARERKGGPLVPPATTAAGPMAEPLAGLLPQ